ncbi:hypothetical protein KIW84_013073 [Lathyrus oleraceus]|uniref:Uncharacterized protein n=1 Tax=Pisum sativum TaxID=3888 RepID=A0A9D5BJF1_PEA|nr:hypothetical protein KIW84_013073 [Pisum sativum]
MSILSAANAVIAYNNRPTTEAVPYFEQLGPAVSQMMPIVEANPILSLARSAQGDAWKMMLDTVGTVPIKQGHKLRIVWPDRFFESKKRRGLDFCTDQYLLEKFDQPVSESLQSRSSKCEVPKGRAIQVEDSVFERQPSIQVRRRHDINSDVLLQIKVQGSPSNDSGSVKSNIHGLSGVGGLISGKNRNKSNSSSGSDVLSDERLANAKKSEESSSQERNEMIPDVVKV